MELPGPAPRVIRPLSGRMKETPTFKNIHPRPEGRGFPSFVNQLETSNKPKWRKEAAAGQRVAQESGNGPRPTGHKNSRSVAQDMRRPADTTAPHAAWICQKLHPPLPAIAALHRHRLKRIESSVGRCFATAAYRPRQRRDSAAYVNRYRNAGGQ